MKFPISYDQFKKNPIKAILFLVLIAVVYLYVENRINYTSQIERCDKQYQICESKITRLRNCDSTLATASTRLTVLNELGLLP